MMNPTADAQRHVALRDVKLPNVHAAATGNRAEQRCVPAPRPAPTDSRPR